MKMIEELELELKLGMNLVPLVHQQSMSSTSQESRPAAAEESLPSSVDTTLRLFTGPPESDHGQGTTTISLAKIRKETMKPSDFLGLGIDLSRNYQETDDFLDHEATMNIGKEVPLDFLGLGIGARSTTTTCKTTSINRRRPRITALSPTPLRSYHPDYGFKDYDVPGTTNDAASTSTSPKRKQQTMNDDQSVGPRKKRARRNKADGDDDEVAGPKPDFPCPELLRQIGPDKKPVFLYRKRLVEWDTDKGQNRLLVNRKEKLMGFLTEEERRAVIDAEGKPGMDVPAIDSMGRDYVMRCKSWASVGKVVFKTSWHKIIEDNNAKVGHVVHLWGYRGDDGKFRLGVEFHA